MTHAMQMDENDFVGTHRILTECQNAAMAEMQAMLENSPEVSQMMTAMYGALSAYVQAVNLRAKAEGADSSNLERPLPDRFVRLGDVSMALGIDGSRWRGVQ